MSRYGTLLLNKVAEQNDVAALKRYGITVDHFNTDAERAAFRFIERYAEENGGQAPSWAALSQEVSQFEYLPEISDSYEYLARKVKDHSGKQSLVELFNGNGAQPALISQKFAELSTVEFAEWLQTQMDGVILRTNVQGNIGRTLSDIKTSFQDEYTKRAEGKSAKAWRTPFDSLTKEIGGFYSGDVYGVMAESGRGKTYLLIVIIDALLRQGANVLVKSFEVKEYVWMARLISVITAVDQAFTDEFGRKVGIPNKQILAGKLEDVVREKFDVVLDALDSYYSGTLYFQGKSDAILTRSLDDLEREVMTGKVDAVVVDPFYGLSDAYGRNSNKTAGGAAEQAATRFEQIIGDNDVVGFYTVQATVEKKQTDEDGQREINLPTRDQVKTSKRLLDIATNLLSFDSLEKDGMAMLGIEKGRNGGEDFRLELMALFDYGVLKEFPSGEAAASQFDF